MANIIADPNYASDIFTSEYIALRAANICDGAFFGKLLKIDSVQIGNRHFDNEYLETNNRIDQLLDAIFDLSSDQFVRMKAIAEQCNVTIWKAIALSRNEMFYSPPDSLDKNFCDYIKKKIMNSQEIPADMENFVDWPDYSQCILENECEIAIVSSDEHVVVEAYALRNEDDKP